MTAQMASGVDASATPGRRLKVIIWNDSASRERWSSTFVSRGRQLRWHRMPRTSQKSTYCIKMNIKGTLVVSSRIDKDSAALLSVPPQKKALSIPGPDKRF